MCIVLCIGVIQDSVVASFWATCRFPASAIEAVQSDLKWTLDNNGSFSIYMFHGGTNWGFQNGADWANALTPVTTSYDYGAPLDESGRTTDIYDALKETITTWVGLDNLPSLAAQAPPVAVAPISLTPSTSLFESLPQPVRATAPTNMEALGQSYGFTLYRHTVRSAVGGVLVAEDAPRDRILVYVNKSVLVLSTTATNTQRLSLCH